MEVRSSRRMRALVTQLARSRPVANEIARALISMMARSTRCSNQRPDTLMQDRSPPTQRSSLATHGRTIQLGVIRDRAVPPETQSMPGSCLEAHIRDADLALLIASIAIVAPSVEIARAINRRGRGNELRAIFIGIGCIVAGLLGFGKVADLNSVFAGTVIVYISGSLILTGILLCAMGSAIGLLKKIVRNTDTRG